MVTTPSPELADAMRILCLHGISKDAWNRYTDRGNWYYEVLNCGFKYNLSDIQSAIGLHQLRKLEAFTAARIRYAALYNELLADIEEVELPADRSDCRHSWHLYGLRLNLNKLEIGRDEFIGALKKEGVGASVHFIPIQLHPFFAKFANLPQNRCPQALALYPRLVSLPLYPAMSEAEVEYVAETVKRIIAKSRHAQAVAMP